MPTSIDAIAPTPITPVPVSTGGLLTTPTTYTPDASLTGQGYNATTGTATGYDATNWNVDRPQTVAGQIEDIIAQGGPLQQQAEARSNRVMNRRGLLSSSMAVQAGQGALYDAALPIASADAATNANSAQFNAGAANTASQFTAGATNTQNLANQTAANTASQFTAGATNTANATNQAATNAAAADNAAAANALTGQANTINAQANQINAKAANDVLMADLDNQFKISITNADAANKLQLQELADATKVQLTSIEADYKTLIQTSASAGEIYKGTLSAISNIVADANMTAESKATAVNGLFNRMGVAMNLIGSINGVDVSDLLDFGTVTP